MLKEYWDRIPSLAESFLTLEEIDYHNGIENISQIITNYFQNCLRFNSNS